MRIEVIDHPVIVLHGWELSADIGQMRGKVLTGAGRAKMPQYLAGRHDKGGDQDPHPMADVLLLTFCWLARLGRLGGIFTLKHLHARLLVDTDDQASLLEEAQGIHVEGTDVASLGVERRIMAMQPVDAPMRFEVGLVEHPPEGGAAHRPNPGVVTEGSRHVIEAPPRRRAVVVCRCTRRERQDVDALRGGKAPRPTWPGRIL